MRKREIVVLGLLLILVLFTGCNKGKAQATGKTDLLLWMPPFGSGDTMDMEFWTRNNAPWAEQNNVNLSIEITPWDNYEEKYLTGFSSGMGPDVGYMYLDMLDQFLNMDTLAPLEPYFTKEEADNYLYYDLGNMRGKQCLIPIIVGNARVLWFNMDLLAKAGITTLPKTWDDFVQMGLKVNAANLGEDIMTFVQEWTGYYGVLQEIYYPFLLQAGGRTFSEDGTRVTLMDNDAAVRAAQFVYDLMYVHNITSEASLSRLNSLPELFSQGKVVSAYMATGSVSTIDASGVNWDFVPSLLDKLERTWVVADFLMVNSASKNKEMAASLIKHMTSAPVMETFHTELFSSPPISKNEAYKDHEKFRTMYSEGKNMYMDPAARNAFLINDNLLRNLQQMMLKEISAQEAIARTVEYANSLR